MDYEKLSSESLDTIFREIRIRNGKSDLPSSPETEDQIRSVVTFPNLEEIDADMAPAAVGTSIGLNRAEMRAKKGISRFFARLVEKLYLRIAELTNRDVRTYNSAMLTAVTVVRNRVGTLFENDAVLMENDKLLEDRFGTILANQDDLRREQMQNRSDLGDTARDVFRLNLRQEKLEAASSENRESIEALHAQIRALEEKLSQSEKAGAEAAAAMEKKLESMHAQHQEDLSVLRWTNTSVQAAPAPERPSVTSGLGAVFYHDFEEHFRGSQTDIRHRLEGYMPRVLEHFGTLSGKAILDIGCGRGEMLDVLVSNGADSVVGVDMNPVQLQICRDKGHNVAEDDCLHYLAELKDNSLDAIIGIQIIEHLSFEELVQLFAECGRVLKKNGMLLLETPNCANLITATRYFYLDPSHVRPVHPELARFLAQRSGFSYVDVFGMNPAEYYDGKSRNDVAAAEQSELLDGLIFAPQDYALIGIRA
ncbi:MAG: class I SAM-dependent methyltransferase [Oscillospiraceae bacterium]|nr:class I SAM-dependent methyltransferase [Oscillospiraceae bacterium]